MEELTTVILSGVIWDAMKKGINISANYLKKKLSNWLLDDKKLEEISEYIQDIPDSYRISEGMLREYLNLNEQLLDILKETKQKNPRISQKSKGNNNIMIGNIENEGTMIFHENKNKDIEKRNLEINRKNLEVNEKQLKILEADHNPYFVLGLENVWKKAEKINGTDKIAKTKYTLINNGGNIKNVHFLAESYIVFYVPTGVEDEWYIFKYQTNNFDVNHWRKIMEEEKGRKFVFYEYASKKDKDENYNKGLKLGKYLSENLNKGITHSYRNILNIIYTDYMGEEKRKIFKFLGTELNELENNLDGVSIGVSLDAMESNKYGEIIRMPIDLNDTETVGKALKAEIEDWMEKNKGAKGYKNVAHVFYNYDIVP